MGVAPAKVEQAVKLIWGLIGLNLLGAVWAIWAAVTSDVPAAILGIVIVTVISSAILFVLSLQIGEGKNWARVVLLVMVGITAISVARDLLGGAPSTSTSTASVVFNAFTVIKLIVGFLAAGMLFHNTSREWFSN